MKFLSTVLALFLCMQFSSTIAVHAETTATIKLNPTNPLPNSSVTLTLESYSFDVGTAMISWQVRGETVLRGQGEESFTVTTGDVGETIPVTVTAETEGGASIEQTITISPSSIILLTEAPDSYTPVLYPGRSLPSDGALVRVTALPQLSDGGVMVQPSSLSYVWYINDTVIKTMSGAGKQTATIRLDYLRDSNEIKVVARTPLGNTGTKTISVYPHSIMPLLYEYDPLLGTNFTKLVSRRFETVRDFSLILEPFYVSRKDPKEPTFEWFLNGLPSTPLGGRILSLHPLEDSYGTKNLTITVNGPDRRIQKAETGVELIFDTRK
jgi:hypothetical protein